MNVQELRDAVRLQLDLEVEDLSNALIDLYLLEAFQQTTANENRWPWLETSWTVSATSDGLPIDMPATFGVAASVTGEGLQSVSHVNHSSAEAYYSDDTSGADTADLFSLWGNQLYLWPKSNSVKTVTVRGWRLLSEDWSGVASGVPDCDSRLHPSMVHYAISRAYAGQEDDQLSAFYLSTWQRMISVTMTQIMRAEYQGPVQMGRGLRNNRSYNVGLVAL
tara:strand:+ start:6823 stop:7485 length:663 start_codon:yes stop_codon:yes gene_type:complete